jgi:exopolysaccharide production protein ExoY
LWGVKVETMRGRVSAALSPSFEGIDTRILRRIEQAGQSKFKRLFDFSAALAILLCVSPLLVLIGCIIALGHGRPILFSHKRIGRGGRTFGCLKFRTMVHDGDQILSQHFAANPAAKAEWNATRKLKDDPRVTRMGAFLRKSSIDELPQLVNVLRGDMSLVGPRPIVRDEVGYYGSQIADYERVRPGLTGPWQVAGRNNVSFDMRVALDSEYASKVSFSRDLAILFRTIPAVLRSNGSY